MADLLKNILDISISEFLDVVAFRGADLFNISSGFLYVLIFQLFAGLTFSSNNQDVWIAGFLFFLFFVRLTSSKHILDFWILRLVVGPTSSTYLLDSEFLGVWCFRLFVGLTLFVRFSMFPDFQVSGLLEFCVFGFWWG